MIRGELQKDIRSPDWRAMLTEMEHTIDAVLRDVKKRERALPKRSIMAENDSVAELERTVQGRLDALKACLDRAERSAGEVANMLDEGKTSVSRWQSEATQLRQRLEAWLGHSVR